MCLFCVCAGLPLHVVFVYVLWAAVCGVCQCVWSWGLVLSPAAGGMCGADRRQTGRGLRERRCIQSVSAAAVGSPAALEVVALTGGWLSNVRADRSQSGRGLRERRVHIVSVCGRSAGAHSVSAATVRSPVVACRADRCRVAVHTFRVRMQCGSPALEVVTYRGRLSGAAKHKGRVHLGFALAVHRPLALSFYLHLSTCTLPLPSFCLPRIITVASCPLPLCRGPRLSVPSIVHDRPLSVTTCVFHYHLSISSLPLFPPSLKHIVSPWTPPPKPRVVTAS